MQKGTAKRHQILHCHILVLMGLFLHKRAWLFLLDEMARPLRLEFTGALRHIASRGDRCEGIYETDSAKAWALGVAYWRINSTTGMIRSVRFS